MSNKKIGTKIEDGSVYAGIVPDTGKMILAAPQDVKDSKGTNLTLTFQEAATYVDKLNRENYLGHNDWHLPTKAESDVLRKNSRKRHLKGTFNSTAVIGKNGAVATTQQGWYWSSTQHPDKPSTTAWYFRIANRDPDQGWGAKDGLRFSCRPVRNEAVAVGR